MQCQYRYSINMIISGKAYTEDGSLYGFDTVHVRFL